MATNLPDDDTDFDDLLESIRSSRGGRVVEPNPEDLEWVIKNTPEIVEKIKSNHEYATDLYRALCNNKFIREDNSFDMLVDDRWWSCSWRYAGGIIADILEKGDYLDWYCSGGESEVRPQIAADLKKLGWVWTSA